MDILSVVAAVFKRWYVTVPIVLAALGAAYYVNSTLPPQYQAQGQVLLASPDLDPEGLPRTVVNLGEVAGEAATTQAQAEIVEGSASITITARIGTLIVDVEGPSEDVVEGTYANAVAWLGEAIAERQDDAGINVEEQLVLQQDGEVQVLELDAGGFQTTARLTLIDPTATAPNPFGANNATARILIVILQSDAGLMQVAERTGPGVGFSVGQNARDAAAIISITTTGAEPERVIEGYDHVADVIEAELNAREARAEVPETRRTRVERIAAPLRVTDTSPPLDRTVAAIIGLGGILALIVAVVWESIASRKALRRRDAEDPESTVLEQDGRPRVDPERDGDAQPAPTGPDGGATPASETEEREDADAGSFFAMRVGKSTETDV